MELLAVEPHGLNLEALYFPRGRVTPTLEGTQVETSNKVALKVSGKGKKLQVRLDTEAGPIVLEFFPDRAHNHVHSFVQLARRGYYNGVSFHRIVPTFVIQGGDPTGSGSGGPGYKLPAEFNEIPHDEGILSMARTPDPHSAGSQFFICLSREATKSLDNQYTVFGRVVSGIEAVRAIGADKNNARRYHMKKAEVLLA
ncbi:MAG: peptidylprolyl isomerase [Planctomycetes bacterium]|nr:peptidylprolyl isomerase [Planctomycetota bacterium]